MNNIPAPDTTPVPSHKLGQAMQQLRSQDKYPCFRLDGLRITAAAEDSTNPGYLYIKDKDYQYVGKITPEGFLKITFPSLITSEQKTLVMAAIVDPEDTAMNHGKNTGICCCCGRKLLISSL